ncbi:7939_t:CDS:2 [Funneliformis geosporum]|uniref:7939_t:CDS:1 n=1 Tax=Funneliformis geosporum TaxID=1117311 RepID=A0A9W4WL04_9GLOM|nr:7939_t:CDS:2 [Funneliformis geosporum]
MQYANGCYLQNYLKNNFNNLNWNDKNKLAFQIANGLNYLHNEDVLHRDLHSKNILIHNNDAKISDFGISKVGNSSTRHIGPCDKTAYINPQILKNPNFQYIKPSDIYSFRILMWEISSGYFLFKALNDTTICVAIVNNNARKITIPDTPKNYEKLYKKCWDQEPKQRPTITEILVEFSRMSFINKPIKGRYIKVIIIDFL